MNNRKIRLRYINSEIAKLKSIQEYCKLKNGCKNDNVRMKIAFLSSVREYILTGKIVTHRGLTRSGNLIENTPNMGIFKYTRSIVNNYFDTLEDYIAFRNLRLETRR